MKISIRNARFAKSGLEDMINYIEKKSKMPFSEMIVCELGSFVGDSTEIFAKRAKEVYAIDAWKPGYDDNDKASSMDFTIIEKQFDELCKQYSNIKKYKMTTDDACKLFDDYFFDVVYVDALHTYKGVKNDNNNWIMKVKKNGFLCGHDYESKHFPGVKRAVDEVFRIDAKFKDSSWIVRV